MVKHYCTIHPVRSYWTYMSGSSETQWRIINDFIVFRYKYGSNYKYGLVAWQTKFTLKQVRQLIDIVKSLNISELEQIQRINYKEINNGKRHKNNRNK